MHFFEQLKLVPKTEVLYKTLIHSFLIHLRKKNWIWQLEAELSKSKQILESIVSGLPKVIFLAVAEAEGEGGKTSALEVEAEGEAEGLVFCI